VPPPLSVPSMDVARFFLIVLNWPSIRRLIPLPNHSFVPLRVVERDTRMPVVYINIMNRSITELRSKQRSLSFRRTLPPRRWATGYYPVQQWMALHNANLSRLKGRP